MPARTFSVVLALACLVVTACGGTPRAISQNVAPISQPTPDPTLDAVVRDLPRALAGVAPTATPTPRPVAPTAKPAAPVRQPTVAAKPTAAPAPAQPTAAPAKPAAVPAKPSPAAGR